MKSTLLGVAMVGLLAGVALLIIAWKLRHSEQALLARPTAPGKIVAIEVVDKAKRIVAGTGRGGGMQEYWQVEVSYDYTVDGKTYLGSRVSNSPRYESTVLHKRPSEKLTSYLQKYPVGSTVPIRYSAGNPEKAYLEIDVSGSRTFAIAGSTALLLAVVAAGFAWGRHAG